ncbi:serine hydrolase domain-containing protein [Ureibacillus sinduriensis]|uniref:Penicillin-binding protein n=1 Tax=Ureibacillus sinduriensis BLB-1 = JCM 15800 TaxID=1384057 RepID=A0A0A3HT52_9BACL|nr:serine hydrolase domain-containing protein [Ureibacillus sinduriensis]KGR74380.1 penicillin-binding protein [Ureibacillus sinduriensis BLB-1 = JCM 15800]
MPLLNINIKERMEHYQVTGLSVSVIRNHEISFVENYGLREADTLKKVNNDSIFSACSISKFVTAMLVMKLVQQGSLDLDEDVNVKLKSWKVPDNHFTVKRCVTLRNLLGHQSGITDPEKSFMELNSDGRYPTMVELLTGKTPYCDVPIEVKYEPETDFQYSDAGFCIIQLIIEDVLGKSFVEVIDELIFHPLKMTNSTYTLNLPEKFYEDFTSGHNNSGCLAENNYPIYPYPAASGLWTTSKDLSQLVLELMNALKNKSKLGISVEQANEMIQARGCKGWNGLGVFLEGSGIEIELSSLGWGEGFQSMLVAFPLKGDGIVIMTNTDLGVHQMKGIIGEIYQSFN